jgi:hypothetical protein
MKTLYHCGVDSMNFQFFFLSKWTIDGGITPELCTAPSISTSTMGLPGVGSVSVLKDCFVETLVQQVQDVSYGVVESPRIGEDAVLFL